MFLTERYEQVIILEVEPFPLSSLSGRSRSLSRLLRVLRRHQSHPLVRSHSLLRQRLERQWPSHPRARSQSVSPPSLILARLFRSDFFPGLGWMLTRTLWEELGPTWPGAYWDDWLRHPNQRKNRGCIRPEVSRSYTFGEMGTSNSQ